MCSRCLADNTVTGAHERYAAVALRASARRWVLLALDISTAAPSACSTEDDKVR